MSALRVPLESLDINIDIAIDYWANSYKTPFGVIIYCYHPSQWPVSPVLQWSGLWKLIHTWGLSRDEKQNFNSLHLLFFQKMKIVKHIHVGNARKTATYCVVRYTFFFSKQITNIQLS